ncbi:MAG: FxsA family protein [Nitrospiria bacterium]
MLSRLIFLFIAIPLIEMMLLIKMGDAIGFWPTILIQVGTGALGATLSRFQGLLVWHKIAREMQSGRIPTEEMINGLLIFAAGIVLLTPGLLTDAAGFAMLIPFTRNIFKAWARRQFEKNIVGGGSAHRRSDHIDIDILP